MQNAKNLYILSGTDAFTRGELDNVALTEYAASAALTAAGAVSGGDMTTEAAVAKLYYLFSKGLDAAAVKEKMGENLRGERSDAAT